MVEVLLTNDDGYQAPGFLAMLSALEKDFSTMAVAPKGQRSWIGKSIGAHEKHYLKKEGNNVYSFTGTPADCVQVGIYDVIKAKPKLVVSGINDGANVGHARILSSGTIGAAMEASIDGVKSIATSIHRPPKHLNSVDFEALFGIASEITMRIVRMFIGRDFPENVDLLVVNIPYDVTLQSEFELTVPDRQPIGQLFFNNGDHHKHSVPELKLSTAKPGTDMWALRNKKVSVTPLSLELVSKDTFAKLKEVLDNGWQS